MGKDNEGVSDFDVGHFHVDETFGGFLVRNTGHTFCEGVENARCALRGEFFEGASAGKHQHHDGCNEVFIKQDGSDDGNRG